MLAGTTLTSAPRPATPDPGVAVPVVRIGCDSATLADAITTANAAPATLRLAPDCTYLLTTALPRITGRVALVGGPSTTLKRAPAAVNLRILDVAATGSLRVTELSILNGSTTTAEGGGIRNAGALVIADSTISGNTTLDQNGGGISNTGHAIVIHSVVASNATQGPTGDRNGGGIYNNGTLTVTGSRLSGNVAVRNGGGLITTAGHTSHVLASTISANSAANVGGGIDNEGTTSVSGSLIYMNAAAGSGTAGGGILNAGGTVTLRRSLVQRNIPDNCAPLKTIPGCAHRRK